MTTEAKHGAHPVFDARIVPPPFGLTIEAYYTEDEGFREEGLTAGGVTRYHYRSDQPLKRRAELLALRSIFRDWWIREWEGHGGRGGDAWGVYGGEESPEDDPTERTSSAQVVLYLAGLCAFVLLLAWLSH